MIEDKDFKHSIFLPVAVGLVIVLAVTTVVKFGSEIAIDFSRPRKEFVAQEVQPHSSRLERAVNAEVERIRQAGEPMPSPEEIVMRAIAGVTEEEQRGSN